MISDEYREMESDEKLLIDAFLSGEQAAVGQIGDWLEEGIRRFRSRLSMPWEDVRQELLLEVIALLRRGGFRGESSLRTFLWRVAKYRCLNLLRDQVKPWRCETEDDELERLPASGSSPLERVLGNDSANALCRLLATLPPDHQELWEMILAGKSYGEMSRDLGLPEGTLRVRVLRSRRKMVALWESWRK